MITTCDKCHDVIPNDVPYHQTIRSNNAVCKKCAKFKTP